MKKNEDDLKKKFKKIIKTTSKKMKKNEDDLKKSNQP